MKRRIKYLEWYIVDRLLVYLRNYPLSYYYHSRYYLSRLKRRLLRQPEPIQLLVLDEAYLWFEKRAKRR